MNINNTKKLNLYTATYPYGWGESYLDAEIPRLQKEFSRIFLFPMHTEKELHRNLNSEITIRQISFSLHSFRLKEELEIFAIMIQEMAKSNKIVSFISHWRELRAILKKSIRIADELQKDVDIIHQKHYSFWMNDWALALAVLKRRKRIDSFFFRVNGFDIYDERHPAGFIPFRQFIFTQTSRIYTVSETASRYLEKKFGYENKIETAHFGTDDFGVVKKNQNNGELRILSCSRMIPLKNVLQLSFVIGKLDFKADWMHHGDGEEFEKISETVKRYPEHIRFFQQTFVANHNEAIQNQKNFFPDVFISLSSTEGLPVTLINAISFGIPIIATDVGGCREVVNEKTGILLPFPVTDEQVLDAIIEVNSDKWQSETRRREIRKFWEENFSAEKCYGEFSRKISV